MFKCKTKVVLEGVIGQILTKLPVEEEVEVEWSVEMLFSSLFYQELVLSTKYYLSRLKFVSNLNQLILSVYISRTTTNPNPNLVPSSSSQQLCQWSMSFRRFVDLLLRVNLERPRLQQLVVVVVVVVVVVATWQPVAIGASNVWNSYSQWLTVRVRVRKEGKEKGKGRGRGRGRKNGMREIMFMMIMLMIIMMMIMMKMTIMKNS